MQNLPASALVLSFVLLSTQCAPKKTGDLITVTYVVGTAEQKSGGADWKPLKLGDRLAHDAVVRTKEAAVLDISVFGAAGVRLLGGSNLDIASMVQDKMHLKISDGNILVKMAKVDKSRDFRVETPTAVASVRGTQFWGQVKKAGEEGVFAVREGSVEVTLKESNKSFVVSQGEAVDIAPGAQKFERRRAADAELGAMNQIDEIRIGP